MKVVFTPVHEYTFREWVVRIIKAEDMAWYEYQVLASGFLIHQSGYEYGNPAAAASDAFSYISEELI